MPELILTDLWTGTSYAHNDNYGFGGHPGWVDVFEELFRFQQTRTTRVREETADFGSILLHLAGQTVVPIYVVLTMRAAGRICN